MSAQRTDVGGSTPTERSCRIPVVTTAGFRDICESESVCARAHRARGTIRPAVASSRTGLNSAEKATRIVELWLDRRHTRRTSDDVLAFYGWLSEHEPALVPDGPGALRRVCDILTPHLTGPASLEE
jgi:hypothetical protein